MEEYGPKKDKVYYHTVSRSFIADPLPQTAAKKLKIASNPEFAGDFAAAGGAGGGAAAANFTVAKVWIEPGCIVCNACEDIYPEVFEVTSDSCIIRPDAPLNDGLKITEAAEACPVEVIKFNKAG
ncbi:MAG: ferredoxin [Deltaproteobacteria bacterium]|nr:MAG: ferredoxin [Deltaproteobacteria bacterium]TNF25499.1 MAG: ferredoxin [Deltaproteobacteria bacterium]